MPSFFISFSVRISTSTPSFSSSFALAANSTGPRTFAGSLTRSRARKTPSPTACAVAKAFLAAITAPVTIVTFTSLPAGLASSSAFFVL
ncbi:hypothetical protein D3C87_1504740 [compost metagenome]